MTPLTLEQIRDATDSKLIGSHPSLTIHCICTDTRQITPGCLFIALKGDNHDGHDHIQAAIDRGAIAAMVDRPIADTHLPLIHVDNTRQAMGRLANHIRRQLKCTVIAVAGSNGKTGTKNLIHAALKNSLTGTISPKSFNNDIGVPTTIFAASPTDDYLILEIGTNHPGEILYLTKIAEPDIAIITNIGAEHLEFLGDLNGVTKENAQIIAGLNPHGLLILNGDRNNTYTPENSDSHLLSAENSDSHPVSAVAENSDSHLLSAVSHFPGRKITFGFEATNELSAVDIRCQSDGVRFRLRGEPMDEIFIPLLGRHTAVNALAAIAVARHLGVNETNILSGLAAATGPEMRLQMQNAGSVKILNDAYNANPHSMRAGLETLRDMDSDGRKVAILGDMRELGETADRYHREIGRFAADCELDHLVCVGEKAALIADAAIEAGMDRHSVERFATAAECAADVGSIITEDDLVLLKASRGMKLETIAGAITSLVAGLGLRRKLALQTRRVIKRPIRAVLEK
jgi:UDP-N-acetylmuramoyl-tripeptide--D-alanyl-D-alanine ligase